MNEVWMFRKANEAKRNFAGVLKPKYNRQGKKWQQLTDSVGFWIAKDTKT